LCFLAITPTALVGVFVSGRFLVAGGSALVMLDPESDCRRPGSISVRGYPLQRCQRFQLICHLPAPGCYALPVTVGGSTELFEPQLTEKAFDIFPARSFASGDW
jgi:hypothetical protein